MSWVSIGVAAAGMLTNGSGGGAEGGEGGAGAGGGGFLGSIGNFLESDTFSSILGGIGGALSGGASSRALGQGRSDILGLPGQQGPIGFNSPIGQGSSAGFSFNPLFAGNQAALGGISPALLGGGLFNNSGLQQALGQNDIAGALGQANTAFGQQASPFANQQGFQNTRGQAQGLGNLFTGLTAGGSQDFSGGAIPGLLSGGLANLGAAGNQQALFNQSLSSQRAAFAPQANRQFNQLQDRLFAQGRLGSTGGAENLRGLFEAQNQADLGFQNNAFGQAQQQGQFLSGLGGQQLGLGQGFIGQNLGQFNQNASNAQNFLGLGAGLEGQAFGQGLQSLQQNQSAGLQRLQAAQGLFGQGTDTFASQFGLGLGAQDSLFNFGQLGLQGARAPFELQAGLLGAGGQSADALAKIATAKRGGGFLGGLFSDERLKDDISLVGIWGGHAFYDWTWNEEAERVGASEQPSFGVLAHEIEEYMPEAVSEKDGYKQVNYNMIFGVA